MGKYIMNFNESKLNSNNKNIVLDLIDYYNDVKYDIITFNTIENPIIATVTYQFVLNNIEYILVRDEIIEFKTKYDGIPNRIRYVLFIGSDRIYDDVLSNLFNLLSSIIKSTQTLISNILDIILKFDNDISKLSTGIECEKLLYERFDEFDVIVDGDVDILRLMKLLEFYNIEVDESEIKNICRRS